MKRDDFFQKTLPLDLIDGNVLALFSRHDAGLYNQVVQWHRAGLLERISKGRYVLSRKRFGQTISNEALACRIVPDAYVSMVSVLAMETMLPESYTGSVISSITLSKPREFHSTVGTFRFRHIKEKAYLGFVTKKDKYGKPFRVATATKALLDLLYLDAEKVMPSVSYLEEGLRLQKTEKISMVELKIYRGIFSKRIDRWISIIGEYKKQ